MKTKLKIIIPAVIAVIAITAAVLFMGVPADVAPADISALMTTAQQYLIENNYEQAIAEFEKILELDPMNVDAYLGLAEAYHDSGDIDKAVEILEKGYELTGDGRIKALLDELNGVTAEETETAVTTVPETETETEPATTTEEAVLMPDLMGMTIGEAVSACEAMSIEYTIQMIENPYAEPGYVMGQSVAADSAVDDDTVVTIIVCEQSRTATTAETMTEITTTTSPVTTTVVTTTTAVPTTTTAPVTTTEETSWWESFTDSSESPILEEDLVIIESGKCGNNVEYTLNDEGLLFIYGSGDMYDYDLSSWGGSNGSVRYFGDESPFGGKDNIKKIIIDNGVTSIGDGIFAECNYLESIDIPDTLLRIGENSFCDSGIKEIIIPQNVEIVGESAFFYCDKLKRAEISAQIVDRYAFAYCENLEEVVLEESVKEFSRMSFNGNRNDNKSLKKIIIKNRECGMSTYSDGYLDTDECIPTQTTIYGYKGSTAEEYAKSYDRKFVALDE